MSAPLQGTYETDIDRDRSRLYLRLEGVLDSETARAAMDEMLDKAAELEPGFDMVNDLSEYEPMSQDATDELERGREGLAEEGLSAVVRITGDSVVGKMQFERVVSDAPFMIDTADSRDAAVELLDEHRREEDGRS